LIVVENEQTQPFLDELVAMMSRLRIGPFTRAPEPFASTVISADQGRRLLDGQQSLIARNATPVVEMHPLEGNDALLSPGLIDVTEVHARPDEENFGPLLNLIRVKDFEAAIDEANDTAYGLSAGLLSSSPERYQQFIRRIRAGIVNWNRQTTGASGRMPFGGCGLSGNHRPSAWHAADYCSYPVASLEAAKLELPADLTPGIDI
jgi:succinylglutamic semialdehyde dehydrogenase